MEATAWELGPDGAAKDPRAFQTALRQDAAKMAELEQDPQLAAVLLGSDLSAMQELLRNAYQTELARAQGAARRKAERSFDAQRASATVPRDIVALYKQLADSGLHYGPAFRLLRNVHVPDTAAAPAAPGSGRPSGHA